MPPLKLTRQSKHYFTKMLNKYAQGLFENKNLNNVSRDAYEGLSVKQVCNYSDRMIKSGDRVYVLGCNMSAYPYEEAIYFVENGFVCLNIRLIEAGESNDDCMEMLLNFEPWEVKESDRFFRASSKQIGFYTLKLSDDYNGMDEFYYAKEYEPNDEEEDDDNWLYAPYYITTKKEDGATWRVLDGSNLSWRLLYPDWYRQRSKKYGDVAKTPRVVLALMQKLEDPVVPRGRYVARVVADKTIDANDKKVSVKFSTTIAGQIVDRTVAAWSPLSSAGDKFRKDQTVLIGLFNDTDDYVIINAEC